MPKFNDGQGRYSDSVPTKGRTGGEFSGNAPAANASDFGRAGNFSASGPGAGSSPPAYVPKFDFSDARNSQYIGAGLF